MSVARDADSATDMETWLWRASSLMLAPIERYGGCPVPRLARSIHTVAHGIERPFRHTLGGQASSYTFPLHLLPGQLQRLA